ncbi:MAG: quinoprotein relay system zinc metallohydrolase 1 [Rhizobiaceae bacterium]
MSRSSRSVKPDQPKPITRRSAVSLIAAGGFFAAAGPANADIAKEKYDLVPRKVGDGIWLIRGSTDYFDQDNGGDVVNCILIETATGIIIVDTGVSLRYGQALAKVAAGLSGLGVAAVINTHHHPDHWFGNQVFADRPIYALAGTKKLAEDEGDAFSDNMYRLLGDWMRGTETTPPTHVLASSSIIVGGREFTVYPLKGHTGADLALLDKKTGILVAGDLAFYNRAPSTSHAILDTWHASIEVLKGVGASAILPGHGPVDRTGDSLNQTEAYLSWLETTLKTAAALGLDMVEIMQDSKIPDDFASLGAMPTEFHRSIAHLYPDIEKQALPLSSRE